MQHALHGIASFGFVQSNFDSIVDGIVESVTKAHEKMVDAHVYLTRGILDGDYLSNINRSPSAYMANPAFERAK